MSERALVVRPRIDALLDGRFDRRLTVVQAGAGFGKTTAIVQMLERNADDVLGVDVWVPLRGGADRPAELAAAIARALPGVDASGDLAASVADAIWHRAPADVALVVDDVPLLDPDGDAAPLLAAVVSALPANGHAVLVGRSAPPVATARLEATGEAVVVDEPRLAFTGEEQTEFLTLRAVDDPPGDLGGWPALLELAAASGLPKAGAFVWEEVVAGLDADHVRDLARVASLDRLDRARLAALTGRTDLDAFVGDLPLVTRAEDGTVQFHALWERVLDDADPGWTADAVDAAWRALVAARDHHEALALVLAHGDESAVEELTIAYAAWAADHQATARLETFLHRLPRSTRLSAGGRLLEGLHVRRSDPRAAKPHLQAARDAFAVAGDTEMEVVTLGLLAVVAFAEWDAAALAEIAAAARAAGTAAGDSTAAMAEATGATVRGEPFEVVAAHLDEARATGVSLEGSDGVAAGVAARLAGVPEAALPYIDRAMGEATRATRPLLAANQFDANFLVGRLPLEVLRALDAGPQAGLAEMSHQATAVSGLLGFANAVAGRRREARRHAERAEAFRHAAARADLGASVIARMAIEILEGDERAAARTADEITEEMVAGDVAVARAVPMAMVVSERVRATYEGADLGACYRVGFDAAAALVALRERDDAGPAATLPWDSPRRLRVLMVPPLVLELAVAAAGEGVAAARTIATELAAGDRAALRRLRDRGPTAARAVASELVKTVPSRPGTVTSIRVLGPLELRRDDEVVDDPLLRRDRVRAMLQFLVDRGSCRRDELGAALWPDFDPESVGNNLRVNLSHLGKLLEPEREKGEPAYLLRVDGDRIELHRDDALVLDVEEFDELVDAADRADRAAEPRRTLELLERAVESYHGDYLEDAAEPEWGEAERTRLRHRLVRAALRAGQLRLAHGDHDEALAHATRARSADEFNEEALRLEARVYLARGDRSTARHVLGGGIAALRDDGFEPEAATSRLAEMLA